MVRHRSIIGTNTSINDKLSICFMISFSYLRFHSYVIAALQFLCIYRDARIVSRIRERETFCLSIGFSHAICLPSITTRSKLLIGHLCLYLRCGIYINLSIKRHTFIKLSSNLFSRKFHLEEYPSLLI